jgi:hypothetical protein
MMRDEKKILEIACDSDMNAIELTDYKASY